MKTPLILMVLIEWENTFGKYKQNNCYYYSTKEYQYYSLAIHSNHLITAMISQLWPVLTDTPSHKKKVSLEFKSINESNGQIMYQGQEYQRHILLVIHVRYISISTEF